MCLSRLINKILGKTGDRVMKKTTFMVYMGGDNGSVLSQLDVDKDIMEMRTVGSDESLNIVVQADKWDKRSGESTTRRYLVSNNFQGVEGLAQMMDQVDNIGPTNTGDPNILINFIDWCVDNYPADRYVLVLWNHGSGPKDETPYRSIFVDRSGGTKETSISSTVRNELSALSNNTYDVAETKAILFDDTSKDFISNLELAAVLKHSYDKIGGKVSILGFDACMMQMLELAAECAPYADKMIGSEEIEPGDGWNYGLALRDLENNPSISTTELCIRIVNAYAEEYASSPFGERITLSALNLNAIQDVLESLDIMADTLISELRVFDSRDKIIAARNDAQAMYDTDYIDIVDFAINLRNRFPVSSRINMAASRLISSLSPGGGAAGGSSFVIHEVSVNYDTKRTHGVAIYHPMVHASITPFYDRLRMNSVTRWKEYLDLYTSL